jgi:murein DD-endopeptidase MepM/ murein hydrolase activator NlpD
MRKLLSLLFSIVLFSACASQRISTVYTPHYPPIYKQQYTVKKSDSLWRIAKEYNVSVRALMQANNISDESQLKVGQRIIIPSLLEKNTRLSFIWPFRGQVINYFGEKVDSTLNKGINIKAESEQNVLAAEAGLTIYADYVKGWGKTIIIKHSEDFYTVYANLSQILTKENVSVNKGEVIGKLSPPARSNNDILHFEIRKGHIAANPLEYLQNS